MSKRSVPAILAVALCPMMGQSISAQNQVFTAVQPCVLFDTRPSEGGTGAMAANELRSFHVVGASSNFVSQGGVAGGCGIPGFIGGKPQISSVLVNLIAINPHGKGTLTSWAADRDEAGGVVVSYQRLSPALTDANAVILRVRQDAEGGDVLLRARNRAVNVRGVVLGYFTPSSGDVELSEELMTRAQPNDLQESVSNHVRSRLERRPVRHVRFDRADVEFREDFTTGMPPGDFQCDVWNHFRSRLKGKRFRRLTFFGSATPSDFVCSDPAAATAVAQALADGSPTPVSVDCGGETWTVGGCSPSLSYDGLGLELTLGNNCDCNFRETVRPCFNTPDWGGLGGENCGFHNPPSQTIILRFETVR